LPTSVCKDPVRRINRGEADKSSGERACSLSRILAPVADIQPRPPVFIPLPHTQRHANKRDTHTHRRICVHDTTCPRPPNLTPAVPSSPRAPLAPAPRATSGEAVGAPDSGLDLGVGVHYHVCDLASLGRELHHHAVAADGSSGRERGEGGMSAVRTGCEWRRARAERADSQWCVPVEISAAVLHVATGNLLVDRLVSNHLPCKRSVSLAFFDRGAARNDSRRPRRPQT